jgi:hypothetical protein
MEVDPDGIIEPLLEAMYERWPALLKVVMALTLK